MNTRAIMPSSAGRTAQAIRVDRDKDVISAREVGGHKKALMLTELTVCLVSSLALMAGLWVLWASFQPLAISFIADPAVTGSTLVAFGLGLYAFGTRGSRRQFALNIQERSVAFGRINSKGTCRINTSIPLTEISSLYVQSTADGTGLAALMLRADRRAAPRCLLTGPEIQVRDLHGQICQALSAQGDLALFNLCSGLKGLILETRQDGGHTKRRHRERRASQS